MVGGRGLAVVLAAVLGAAAFAAALAPGADLPDPGNAFVRTTSREDLALTVAAMTQRLRSQPDDGAAAASLADALLRQTRVANDPALAVHAEQALRRALAAEPLDYPARRMLGAVLLSQHRFREAIREASRARQLRPSDAWNDGVIGDAHLELGEYDEAFAAFDRMAAARPDAASYARVSYAREMQGDLDGAIHLMTMALEATPARDPESLAWHETQLGHLLFASGKPEPALRHFARADFLFPGYGPAAEGRVRLLAASGDAAAAWAQGNDAFAAAPTPVLAACLGDLARQRGDAAQADRFYQIAEELWRREPVALARFLADRGRDIPRAVALAEAAAAARRDIFTADALAWALFRAGRRTEALPAIRNALRTGTADREILAHAAAIHLAAGEAAQARRLAERALAGASAVDAVAAAEARRVLLHSGDASVARQLH
jgi:tetratricopeptide (TPR) repeat protein